MNIILNNEVLAKVPGIFKCDQGDHEVKFFELDNYDLNRDWFTCSKCEESKQGKERFYL